MRRCFNAINFCMLLFLFRFTLMLHIASLHDSAHLAMCVFVRRLVKVRNLTHLIERHFDVRPQQITNQQLFRDLIAQK